MRGTALAVAVVLALAAAPGAAEEEAGFRWRSLGLADFQGAVPPLEGREREGGVRVAAAVSPAIERAFAYRVGPDGGIVVTAVRFTARFDPRKAWADREGLTPAREAALLRHEQGHFDITESAVREMTAAAPVIAAEITDAFAADPARREAMAALSREIEATPPARRAPALARRVALLEGASPTLGRLFAGHHDRQADYDRETRHGIDPRRQATWSERIRLGLEQNPSRPAAH